VKLQAEEQEQLGIVQQLNQTWLKCWKEETELTEHLAQVPIQLLLFV
jgi:hypothetical protein